MNSVSSCATAATATHWSAWRDESVRRGFKPIPLAALSLQVGVSVGVSTGVPEESACNVAMAARDGGRVETVLRQADMAMYWAKSEGRGRYRFFDRSMDERLQLRVALEAEIKGAIAAGQIVPYYQSIIDLHSRETVGFEVLARWEHPKRGLLCPTSSSPLPRTRARSAR